MLVQRKWMYLESIFIGGDIRSQLPGEAEKFDDIDRVFKKVSAGYLMMTAKYCMTTSPHAGAQSIILFFLLLL